MSKSFSNCGDILFDIGDFAARQGLARMRASGMLVRCGRFELDDVISLYRPGSV